MFKIASESGGLSIGATRHAGNFGRGIEICLGSVERYIVTYIGNENEVVRVCQVNGEKDNGPGENVK